MIRIGPKNRHLSRAVPPTIPVIGLLLLLPAVASATVLSGSLRSTLYTEQSRAGADRIELRVDEYGVPLSGDQLPDLTNRTRLVETLRLDALGLGLDGLSFHTAVTGSNFLTDQSIGDTRFRLYRSFLQYEGGRRNPLRYDLKAGRHWVLAGVGSGLIDGVSAKLGRRGIGEAAGFFGTLGTDRLASTDRVWSVDSPSDSRAEGGRIRLARVVGPFDPQVSASYARAERTPHEERVVDHERFGVSGELRMAPGARGGRCLLRGVRAYGDYRRDLVYGRNLSTTGGIDYAGGPRDLTARIEYMVRRPALSANSFFASFNGKPVEELRGGLGAAIGRGLRLDLDGSLIQFTEGEDDTGLGVMVSGYDLTVGYRLHRGYGGDLAGLILYGHRSLGEKLTLDAAIDYAAYQYGKVDQTDLVAERDDTATSGLLALGYRWSPALTFTGQVEGLSNAERSSDVRFLGMVQWRFRTTL